MQNNIQKKIREKKKIEKKNAHDFLFSVLLCALGMGRNNAEVPDGNLFCRGCWECGLVMVVLTAMSMTMKRITSFCKHFIKKCAGQEMCRFLIISLPVSA